MADNANWVLNIPSLAGVQPIDPTFTNLPTGPFQVLITATGQSEKGTIAVHVSVTEAGPVKGLGARLFLGADFSKDGVKKQWVGALKSIGAPEAALASGGAIGPAVFLNKTAYIYSKAPVEGEGGDNKYSDLSFISPEMYAKLKADQASRGGATTTAATTPAAAAFNPTMAPALPSVGQIPQPTANGVAALGQALSQAPVAGASPFGALP